LHKPYSLPASSATRHRKNQCLMPQPWARGVVFGGNRSAKRPHLTGCARATE